MSALTYTAEAVTLNNTLETLTLRSTNNVYKLSVVEDFNCNGITEVILLVELELGRNGEKGIDAYALLRAIGLVSVDQLGLSHMPATGYTVNHHRLAYRVVSDNRVDSGRKWYVKALAVN